MTNRPERLSVGAICLAALACGDPVLVLGDNPGIMRRVAGVPESAGSSVGASALDSQLAEPRGLAVDGNDVVYVASTASRMVQRFAVGGALEVVARTSSCANDVCVARPVAVLPDGLGGLYVADIGAHAVFLLDLSSGTLTLIAGTGVQGTAADGSVAAASPLSVPSGLALDASGRPYFAEAGSGRVRRVESDGTLVTVAGSGRRGSEGDGGPATEASLGAPAGLALDGDVLYVADRAEHRIRAVDLATGTIRTIAGNGTPGFSGDGGPAIAASLDSPSGIAVADAGSTLFIADSDNNRVRRVSVSGGGIDTFAGTGSAEFTAELEAAGVTPVAAPAAVATDTRGGLFIAASGHHIVWRTTIER
ncbi:MAG: hypothetical protein ABFS34_13375 [Gemmatimonadota bacterium]